MEILLSPSLCWGDFQVPESFARHSQWFRPTSRSKHASLCASGFMVHQHSQLHHVLNTRILDPAQYVPHSPLENNNLWPPHPSSGCSSLLEFGVLLWIIFFVAMGEAWVPGDVLWSDADKDYFCGPYLINFENYFVITWLYLLSPSKLSSNIYLTNLPPCMHITQISFNKYSILVS